MSKLVCTCSNSVKYTMEMKEVENKKDYPSRPPSLVSICQSISDEENILGH
jgi:hypothetical protein